jgi:hypothetical protein
MMGRASHGYVQLDVYAIPQPRHLTFINSRREIPGLERAKPRFRNISAQAENKRG